MTQFFSVARKRKTTERFLVRRTHQSQDGRDMGAKYSRTHYNRDKGRSLPIENEGVIVLLDLCEHLSHQVGGLCVYPPGI